MNRKERRNSKKKRKIVLALLMLLLSGAVLGTGTYAWFTANKVVSITQIDVNVATSNGLQISADGINFKTIITAKEMLAATKAITTDEATGLNYGTYASGINQIPNGTNAQLSPVSTGGTVSGGMLPMYSGSIDTNDDGDNIIVTSANKETEANSNTSGSFIAFDMFLKVNSAAQIYLGESSNVIATTSGGTTDTGIQNAARVAFVYEGNTAATSTSAVIQGLTIGDATGYTDGSGTENVQTVKIWEPNSQTHTDSGRVNAINVYGKGSYYNSDANTWSNIPYDGVIASIAKTANVPLTATSSTHPTLLKSVTPFLYTNGTTVPAETKIFYLAAGITKFRVYMWVEGQDVDCENNASGGSISLNLQFKMADSSSSSASSGA